MALFKFLGPRRFLLKEVDTIFAFDKSKIIRNGYMKVSHYSVNSPKPKPGGLKFTLISASVGAIIGVGYSGFTHYQINKTQEYALKKNTSTEPVVLEKLPDYKPTTRIVNPGDDTGLQLVLFQYQTCPFCCKVRSFLDSNSLSYDIVEVDAVLRQSIKWSKYKKVPILLVKTNAGYQQLNDSTTIISILTSFLMDTSQDLNEVIKYYPTNVFVDEKGKESNEVFNKYYLMFNSVPKDRSSKEIEEERKWRKWTDEVLVHTLSPNVYRTKQEALQTFNWFAEVGQWRENFPAWECSIMINVGAFAMWLIGKRLKERHHLKEDVRCSLYDECNYWTQAVNDKGSMYMGGSTPDLSDLAVYGVLSSIEGCDAFKDVIVNTNIGRWFSAMKTHVESNRGAISA